MERVVLGGVRAFGRGDGDGDVARLACLDLDERWDTLSPEERESGLRSVLSRVDYDTREQTVTMQLADGVELVCPLQLGRKRDKQLARGTIPRVARLMALAIHFRRLLSDGLVADYAELALRGSVTRARITQIMNLLHLAPDIQERLLFLRPVTGGRAPLTEHALRDVIAQPSWTTQRRILNRLLPA